MKIEKLLSGIKVIKISDNSLLSKDIDDISFDNRNLKDNSIFIAMRGEFFDSHDVINEVFASGKIICVVSEKEIENIPYILVDDSKEAFNKICLNYFEINQNKLTKIAITGTNGKTTTSYLIDNIFSELGKKTIKIGTVEYNICGKKIVANNTTPGMYDVCKMINMGISEGAEVVIMEVSSHSLKQKRIYGLRFDISVFTNLSGDHLDYHKDMEDYYDSKKMLFTEEYSDKCVINIENEYGEKLFNEININKSSCAVSKKSDFYPNNIEYSIESLKCQIRVGNENIEINSHLTGKHNLENIMCAVAAACKLSIDKNTIERGINNLSNIPGRLEKIENKGVFYFIDYAHTDDALLNVLQALNFYKKSRVITVFGCGGDRDRTKRPRMAKVAEKYSDIVIVTSDNPRTEDPNKIIDDILNGFENRANATVIPDRREAIKHVVKVAQKGDIVLIAGKGHEDYQIIGTNKIHFDDKEELLKALENI